ncbi:MAG TPA: PhpK family radical SAM P-methyltransferase, partial [Chloroflexia bacterium]|nr:PhpK family radical SAM P-methyltransferase [Chloroflexia bacterium]
MIGNEQLDCLVIGYNEMPITQYEPLLRKYGEDSEAYRDLRFSFVDLEGEKLNYVDLMNRAFQLGRRDQGPVAPGDEFKSGDIPNLAAVYLTNYLRKKSFSAKYINLFQYEKERLAQYLAEDPLCVAITTTFYVLNLPVIEMIEFIRECNSKVKIMVGGPLVANHHRRYPPEELLVALEELGADIYVIESQGEWTLSQIVGCLKNGGDLGSVPNIVYNDGRQMRMTETRHENNSLDEDAIDWEGFSGEDLGPTLQTRTARSCAFSCAFCAYPMRAGTLTLASLDTIKRELDSMRNVGGVKNVVFIDDTFNVPLKRFKEICRLMIAENYGFNWFSYFRCSNSDEEAIELMAESGCKGVFLGIESGSPTILKNMHKAATIEQYARGIESLRQHGVLTFGSFIFGFPGETEDTINETIDFIRHNRPDYYRTQLWYCEPGTPIYEKRAQYDITGTGFKWRHATMESLEAMDYIEEAFLTIDESLWLPQWSFDFWIIPYFLGKGISIAQFRDLMTCANRILEADI